MQKIKSSIQLVLILLVLIFLAWYFSRIFWYVIISLVLTTVLKPTTNYFSKIHIFNLKMPRLIAVLFSFGLLLFVFFAFIVLFIPLVSEQVSILATVNYEEIFVSITGPIKWFEQFLIANDLTVEQEGFITGQIWDGIKSFGQTIDIRSILNNILNLATGFFIGVLAITFITFMLLYEKGILKRNFISLIPNRYFEIFITLMNKIEKLLSNYLLGLLFQIFSIFSIASIGLSVFGIKYAVSIALFAAVANLIPYAGPILGAIFGIIVGLSTGNFDFGSNESIIFLVEIISVFALVQLIDNLVLQPLIFSKSVKAHPLEIFVVIFAGATIAGIPGMILAIPAYTILRVFVIELYTGYKSYYIFKN